MSELPNVRFLIDGLEIRTDGLRAAGHQELSVQVASSYLLLEAQYFLRYAVAYIKQSKAHIQSGQTIGYGYWHTKFQARNEELLEAWEYKSDGSEYVLGASLTLFYWQEQHRICKKFTAPFKPPRADQLVAVSAGVMEGAAVQGARYPSPSHMSGWWLSTNQYDGSVQSMVNQHCYHVTHTRPELASYLALPNGFRFDFEHGQNVSFDENAAHQPIV